MDELKSNPQQLKEAAQRMGASDIPRRKPERRRKRHHNVRLPR